MVGCLDILEVVSLVAHQQIDYFLQLAQDYNEDLIRIFYFGLHDRRGSCFKFTIGNTVYESTDELWKSIFEITIVDVGDHDEADPLVMDTNTYIHFKWNIHVNKLLKARFSNEFYDHITTSQLKMVHRILLQVVSRILHPKNYEL